MTFVDVHAHYDERDYPFPNDPAAVMRKTDLESFRTAMDAAQVERVVFFAGLASIMEAPATDGGLQDANRRLLDVGRPHPGKLAFGLLVHPSRVADSVAVIEKYHGAPNVVGVGELLPTGHFNGHEFNTAAMQQIAECAASHGLPMNFHTGSAERVRQIAWLAGRVPTGQYILAHAAGRAVEDGLALMAEKANVWMDLSVHAWKPGVREPLVARADRARLLFGSDFPIESYPVAVEHFQHLGFNPQDMERIARLNALRLFPKLQAAAPPPSSR